MFLFKTIDEKLESIGFIKVEDNPFYIRYERYSDKFEFTQVVDISYKRSGRHILQSYDRDLFDTNMTGNCCVGLTAYEMQLFVKKMKSKGLFSH